MSDFVPIVISNVIVASLIGCLAWFVGRSGHRARLAHGLWVAFFLKLVTPPLITLPIDVPSDWCPSFIQSESQFFSTHLRNCLRPVQKL